MPLLTQDLKSLGKKPKIWKKKLFSVTQDRVRQTPNSRTVRPFQNSQKNLGFGLFGRTDLRSRTNFGPSCHFFNFAIPSNSRSSTVEQRTLFVRNLADLDDNNKIIPFLSPYNWIVHYIMTCVGFRFNWKTVFMIIINLWLCLSYHERTFFQGCTDCGLDHILYRSALTNFSVQWSLTYFLTRQK